MKKLRLIYSRIFTGYLILFVFSAVLFNICSELSFAQEQTIELKKTVVADGKSVANQYQKNDSLEAVFQLQLPQNLNRAITRKLNIPLDTRILDWSLNNYLTLSIEFNTTLSVYWNNELFAFYKITDDIQGYLQKNGMVFDIVEQSLQFKNSFEWMQALEKFWSLSSQRIRLYRFDYAGRKAKIQTLWLIVLRSDTDKESRYHMIAHATGMGKPLELSVPYQNLFVDETVLKASEASFGTETGIWQEQYKVDKNLYTDILITLAAPQQENGVLLVLRYMDDEYLGHGVFNYIETLAR